MAPTCPACRLSRAAVDAVIADASRTRGERDDLRIELERAYNLLDGTDPLAVALRGLFGWQSGSVARIVAEVRRLQRFETTMLRGIRAATAAEAASTKTDHGPAQRRAGTPPAERGHPNERRSSADDSVFSTGVDKAAGGPTGPSAPAGERP